MDKGFGLKGETNTVFYDPEVITLEEMTQALKDSGTFLRIKQ